MKPLAVVRSRGQERDPIEPIDPGLLLQDLLHVEPVETLIGLGENFLPKGTRGEVLPAVTEPILDPPPLPQVTQLARCDQTVHLAQDPGQKGCRSGCIRRSGEL